MKNIKFLALIIAAAFMAVLFTQCNDGEEGCTMRIKCYKSSDNVTPEGQALNGVWIEIDTSKYTYTDSTGLIRHCDPELRNAKGYTRNGCFEHTFRYPALLVVTATYMDTIMDMTGSYIESINKYTGTAQVKIEEGETVEKEILMRLTY